MGFQPGNAEHLKAGRRRPRMITQQIISALNELAADGEVTKARKLVDALIAKALEGDVQAMKEVFDRAEGKVPQAVIGGDEDDAPIRISRIEIVAATHDPPR